MDQILTIQSTKLALYPSQSTERYVCHSLKTFLFWMIILIFSLWGRRRLNHDGIMDFFYQLKSHKYSMVLEKNM